MPKQSNSSGKCGARPFSVRAMVGSGIAAPIHHVGGYEEAVLYRFHVVHVHSRRFLSSAADFVGNRRKRRTAGKESR
jgi:hypothetical protein